MYRLYVRSSIAIEVSWLTAAMRASPPHQILAGAQNRATGVLLTNQTA